MNKKFASLLILVFLACTYSALIAQENMSLTFNTALGNGTTVTLPLHGTVDVTVDWGDGTTPQSITTAGNLDYTYAAGGVYTVSISGNLTHFGSWSSYTNAEKLISCTSFGDLGITNLEGAFRGAVNLIEVPNAIPSTVTRLSRIFIGATSFNQDISSWDMGSVNVLEAMFYGATLFNQDLSNWNVSNVLNMGFMFSGATSFNQNLNDWDVSSVTVMNGMFSNAISFNQDLSNWDVSGTVSMAAMFGNAISFNQDLSSWDVSSVVAMGMMFNGATSFNQDLSSWDVSSATDTKSMFFNAVSFNQDLSTWDVSNVKTMQFMFKNAMSFNQDLSSWNVSSVMGMQEMFNGVKLSTVNYNNLLTSWSQLTLRSNVSFDAGASNYSEGASSEARQSILDNYGWTITDGGMVGSTLYEISASIDPAGAGSVNGMEFFSQQYGEGEIATLNAYPNYNHKFISWTENGTLFSTENPIEFETTQNRILVANFEEDNTSEPMSLTFNTELSSGTSVSLPLLGYVNVLINWGDGITEIIETNGLKNHTYAEEGTYTLTITGTLTQYGYATGYINAEKLISVSSFGDLGLTSLRGAFRGAANLSEVPEVIPSTVTDLSIMFGDATSFNQNINTWDVSNVTDMHGMFYNSTAFNQGLSTWDVSSVTNMGHMFNLATSFNQNLNSWDVSGVTNMYGMFYNSTSFNQSLSAWDVSNVTSMGFMFFSSTSFNQDLSAWDVSSVISMRGMFWDSASFNQYLGAWAVSSVGNMDNMFRGAISFNQDLSTWDVSSVRNMQNMFFGATSYNQDVSTWDVSNVTNMSGIFNGATSFNQDLSAWDVNSVRHMDSMFNGAISFNQNLSTWDVSNVMSMGYMFNGATSFNQDLSSWDVSSVTSMWNMFKGVKLSTVNYNSLLTGWSQQTLHHNVYFHAGASKYSEGAPAEARQSIINNYGWTITDGGMVALYEITASTSPAGAGKVNGSENFSQQYEEGETATLIAIPQTGYYFVSWTEDGAEVFNEVVYSFTVTQDRNLVANFEMVNTISEVISNTRFIVYPNPASDLINITLDNYDLNSDKVELVLYDLSGKTYRIENFSVYQNKMSLNVSDRTPGIYFIQMIINGEKVETAKVKIMR